MIDERIELDTTYIIQNVPFLYNYMSEDGALKFIENTQLMVSKPSRFNDPYDCLLELMEIKTIPKEYSDHKNFNKEKLKRHLREETLPRLMDFTGISCFSETGTNMLMWSHYANSHKGICVAYDLREFYFTLKENNDLNCDSTLIKINYTKDFTPIDLFKDPKTAFYNWMSTKSDCWSYEKEIRITFRDFPFEKNKSSRLINFNRNSIKKIFFGSKIEPENQKLIIKKLKNINPNIEFYKMEREPNSFELKPRKI